MSWECPEWCSMGSDPMAFHAAILAGIERWCRSQDWVEDEGKFIKAPLVWLNQENWNDDPAPYSPRRTKAELEAEAVAARKEESRRAAIAALTANDWALCELLRVRRMPRGRRRPSRPPDQRPPLQSRGVPALRREGPACAGGRAGRADATGRVPPAGAKGRGRWPWKEDSGIIRAKQDV